MPRIERKRTAIAGTLEPNSLEQMNAMGWRAVAIEWKRETGGDATPAHQPMEELPYGLRVAQDCHHLEEDPQEMEALHTIMEMIVQDAPLTRIAQELNRRSYPTRDGVKWTPLSVYQIFPRLIEVTPRIFGDAEWKTRRPDLTRVAWNS